MKLAPLRAFPLLLLCTACFGGAAPAPAPETPAVNVSDAEAAAFSARIEKFYGTLEGLPLDALVTYENSTLRDCFTSPASFSDYFSALATAARLESFRYTTARHVKIREFNFESADEATVDVSFISVNQRTLRFWSIHFDRVDSWKRNEDGVWRIVPAKL
jgi:hypothetical protein